MQVDALVQAHVRDRPIRMQVGVPPGRISDIIAGKRAITADTALRLGKFFGTEPEFWMNLQRNYELRVARNAIGPELEKIPIHAA